MTTVCELPFNVDPNLITELGINLYTDLHRVLAEFIANAWDADAEVASVHIDFVAIRAQRKIVGARYDLEADKWKREGGPQPLELGLRPLDPNVSIIIRDDGIGMNREELEENFLKVGRKRRKEAEVTASGRPLMGRKGIGKLSGFGVAQVITVTSRKEGEEKASRIFLDYNKIKEFDSMKDVKVPFDLVDPPNGLMHGTIISLSSLVYEGTKNRFDTVKDKLIESFSVIGGGYDFLIELNDEPLEYPPLDLFFSFPEVPGIGAADKVEASIRIIENTEGIISHLPTDSMQTMPEGCHEVSTVTVKYSIWFNQEGKHVPSNDRGVRIYAHGRLVHPPHLFDLKTATHGFKYTSYLGGVLEANFIDDQAVDLVATDRQGLKWDHELLAGLREWITERLSDAVKAMARKREIKADEDVKSDPYTKQLISTARLTGSQRKLAYSLANKIAAATDGVTSEEYQFVASEVIKGIGNGELLTKLSGLSKTENLDISVLVKCLLELSGREYEDFAAVVRGRLDGIEALSNVYKVVDFTQPKNEKILQDLLSRCPWLIDPMYSKFITSDHAEAEMFVRLARELMIENFTTVDIGERAKKRPDLTFLLGDRSYQKIVIVELKAPNIPLEKAHLQQLEDYISDTERFLKAQGKEHVQVRGYLIGTRETGVTTALGRRQLQDSIDKRSESAQWEVWDISMMLERTRLVHREFLDKAAPKGGADA